jgi:hypothetical protein
VNSTKALPFRQLETGTRDFRDRLAREHRSRWTAEHARAARALDRWDPLAELADEHGEVNPASTPVVGEIMRDALSVAKWHRDRDNGQKYRFRKLERCGDRVVIARCGLCQTDGKPHPESCGITRLCEKCSLQNAKKRRARFGSARKRVSIELNRLGYTRKRRKLPVPGGRWSDKMITLTIPHFLLPHVDEDAEIRTGLRDGERLAKVPAYDTVMARIYAVRFAWPLFARKLGAWFKKGGMDGRRRRGEPKRTPIGVPLVDGSIAPPPMHRAFEWTPGGDGLGHPHFHLWTIAPFIPEALIQKWWREALIAVGVPLAPDAYVRVQVQAFRHFDFAAVGELLKGGNRQSLEWSRLYTRGGRISVGADGSPRGRKPGPSSAFEYADGWTIAEALRTCADPIVSSLYMALEGTRLTQGSSGFFDADEPPTCSTCGAQGCWHVRFEVPRVEMSDEDAERSSIQADCPPAIERGPPDARLV